MITSSLGSDPVWMGDARGWCLGVEDIRARLDDGRPVPRIDLNRPLWLVPGGYSVVELADVTAGDVLLVLGWDFYWNPDSDADSYQVRVPSRDADYPVVSSVPTVSPHDGTVRLTLTLTDTYDGEPCTVGPGLPTDLPVYRRTW